MGIRTPRLRGPGPLAHAARRPRRERGRTEKVTEKVSFALSPTRDRDCVREDLDDPDFRRDSRWLADPDCLRVCI